MTRFAISLVVFALANAGVWGQDHHHGSTEVPTPDHPVKIKNGKALLSPENTLVQFVGTHAGPEPNPRVGHFQKFRGKAELDESGTNLKTINILFETASLWTPIPNLTNHLKSPDFLETREYPEATFMSSSVEQGSETGQMTIVGKFTLHGTSQEIRVPAELTANASGMTLTAKFVLDRTQFGIDQLQDRVNKEVEITVVVGVQPPGKKSGVPQVHAPEREREPSGAHVE